MAPMKLYGSTMSWNMTRSALALEEAGADYEIVPINFATAEHKSPEHLARNVRILPAPSFPLLFFRRANTTAVLRSRADVAAAAIVDGLSGEIFRLAPSLS